MLRRRRRGGALISWQKAQKSFRTTPQKPNSLKRSAQAVVPPFAALPPLHTYSSSGRANTTMNNRTISTLHGSPQRERARKKESEKGKKEEGKGKEKGRKTQTLTQSRAELSLSQVQKKRAKKIRALTRAGVKSSSSSADCDAGSGKVFPSSLPRPLPHPPRQASFKQMSGNAS